MNLASFYHHLPYFIRQAVLASRYSKGWFNQITDSATFEPSDLIAVINFLKQMAESCAMVHFMRNVLAAACRSGERSLSAKSLRACGEDPTPSL